MPDPSGSPDPAFQKREGRGLLREISRALVAAKKEYYGKGPVHARSYLVEDLLFVVMRGGTTTAEETMLEAGQKDMVREFRQRFQNEMAERLTGTIEQLTGRKVINYQSQILFDPDIVIEIFVFEEPVAKEAREETAAALLDPDDGGGEVAVNEDEVTAEG